MFICIICRANTWEPESNIFDPKIIGDFYRKRWSDLSLRNNPSSESRSSRFLFKPKI